MQSTDNYIQIPSVKNDNTGGRIVWIDIARGIGMILVVLGHADHIPTIVRRSIFLFHMPLFFFLSGITYKKGDSFFANTKRDIKRLIIPYWVTVILISIFLFFIISQGKIGFYIDHLDLLKSALLGFGCTYHGIKYIGEPWFLITLFWARRIMDLCFLSDSRPKQMLISCVSFIIGIAISYTGHYIPRNIDIAMVSVIFMYIGHIEYYYCQSINKVPFWICNIILSIIALRLTTIELAARNYGLLPLSFLGAISISNMICAICRKLQSFEIPKIFLSFIGRHSLLFLCIHSLDWRMPFSKPGSALLTPFSGSSFYWILTFLHRFIFDMLITTITVMALTFLKRALSKIKDKMQMKNSENDQEITL